MSKLIRVLSLVLFVTACTTSHPDVENTRELEQYVAEADWQGESALEMSPVVAPVAALDAMSVVAAPRLAIHMFDIGQADSMLLIGPPPDRKTLLIDLGRPTQSSKLPPNFTSSQAHVLRRIKELTGENGVDYFLLTHYHADHASAMISVLNSTTSTFHIGAFIRPGPDGSQFLPTGNGTRSVFHTIEDRMPTWIAAHRVDVALLPTFGTTLIDLGAGVEIDVLAFSGMVPGGASAFDRALNANPPARYNQLPGDENDLSIALEITAGEFELFTAGDLNGTDNPATHPFFAERSFGGTFTNIEHHLADHWTNVNRESDVEVYRANHHGSGFSTTARLLNALDPEFVLYSSGADTSGHPSNVPVRRSGQTARQFATTAVNDPVAFRNARGTVSGEITILVATDGASYTINGEKHLTFTDAQERAGDDVGEEVRQH